MSKALCSAIAAPSLRRAVQEWIEAGSSGDAGASSWGAGPVYLLSRLWALGAAARAHAYDCGYLPRFQASVPVISVGSISSGGTGKTPLLSLLAELLAPRRVGIITRGYGSGDGPRPLEVRLDSPVSQSGDEALLLKRWHPQSRVMVDVRRERAIQTLRDQVDVVLLDDGFQHLQVARALDLAVISARGPGAVLPLGGLREGPRALHRADRLICQLDPGDTNPDRVLSATLPGWWTQHGLEVRICSTLVPRAWRRLTGVKGGGGGPPGPESLTPDRLRGTRVVAFTGIARGWRLRATLESLGAEVIAQLTFADHHLFSPQDLAQAEDLAREGRASWIVTSEKDAVRLPGAVHGKTLPGWSYLEMKLELVVGEELLKQDLDALFPASTARRASYRSRILAG